MKSRPILFSGPLIRALLNTKPDVWPAMPIDPALPCKWQTRRICEHSPIASGPSWNVWYSDKIEGQVNDAAFVKLHCPYGVPGDLLWVRECFYLDERNTKGKFPQEVIYAATPEWAMDHTGTVVRVRFITGGLVSHEEAKQSIGANQFWHKKPSIHLPRWASRLTLEVESVRVERVRDITEEDALAEGVRLLGDGSGTFAGREGPGDLVTPWLSAREAFIDRWNALYGSERDWTWAITFKRLSQEAAQRRLAA